MKWEIPIGKLYYGPECLLQSHLFYFVYFCCWCCPVFIPKSHHGISAAPQHFTSAQFNSSQVEKAYGMFNSLPVSESIQNRITFCYWCLRIHRPSSKTLIYRPLIHYRYTWTLTLTLHSIIRRTIFASFTDKNNFLMGTYGEKYLILWS